MTTPPALTGPTLPPSMRVARTVARATIAFEDAPLPSRRAGEVLVRVHAVSLCGTDLHIFHDHYPTDLPLVQGHELAGVVLDAGPESRLAVGERVAVDPLVACGACHACRMGRGNVCPSLSVLGCYEDGGFAEVVRVCAERVHRVPGVLPTDVAALAEPCSIALQAVHRGEPSPGDVALVLGCGPIGLLATLGLAERGLTVIAADIDPQRVALAQRFGAVRGLEVGDSFPTGAARAALDEVTGGTGPTLVIEATGAPASLETAIRVVAPAGRIVQVGISSQAAQVPLKSLTDKEIDLRGSRNSQGRIPEALELLARHPGAVAALVTHRFPFERLEDAFRTMGDRSELTGKILIDMPGAREAAA